MFATLETFILRGCGIIIYFYHNERTQSYFIIGTTQGRSSSPTSRIERTVGRCIKRIVDPNYAESQDPLTLRQLASHISGIGRGYPPADWTSWPEIPDDQKSLIVPSNLRRSSRNKFTPTENFPTIPKIMDAIVQYPLVAPSYSYPIYSNTDFSLLGWCIVAATKAADPTASGSYAEDIVQPLSMNGSTFLVSTKDKAHLAFPSAVNAHINEVVRALCDHPGYSADPLKLKEPRLYRGSQCFGWLILFIEGSKDLATVMQMFLDPEREGSIITLNAMREWLGPLRPWLDGLTEVRAVWEIIKFDASHGNGKQRYYRKCEPS